MPQRNKKSNRRRQAVLSTVPFILADSEQEYGIITEVHGDCHFTAICQDGMTRRCKVRGNMRKKIYVNKGDTVIVSKRDFDDHNADIVHVYPIDQVRQLRKNGILTMSETGQLNQQETDNSNNPDDDEPFDFESI